MRLSSCNVSNEMSETSAATNPFAHLWTLDPSVDYLNHASFGACPRAVVAAQAELRVRMEKQPVDFLWRELSRRLDEARGALAGFVGADPAGLVFVPNATFGVNSVVRSLDLEPGDELLTTDHVYAACKKTLLFVASKTGARVVLARVPFPLAGEGDVVAAVLAAVTPKTRLALLDHVTSPTALVFPIQRLVAELAARGVDTLVDGAHALGMVPLDLGRFGAAYYTANAHKWLCAPKGAAFLHVRADRRTGLHPVVTSHGWDPEAPDARFREEFDWTGTSDPTAVLSIPFCIEYLGGLLPGGWRSLMEKNRELALRARGILLERFGGKAAAPSAMVGSMASVLLPSAAPGSPAFGLDRDALSDWVRARGVESWFHYAPPDGRMLVRASAQLYNDESQYVRLADLLAEALGVG
jgi:isopenicillin-N epimerase